MGGNPNTSVNLRRHKSTPSRRSSSIAAANLLRPPLSKGNPYVGWFRHAPPSTLRHQQQQQHYQKRKSEWTLSSVRRNQELKSSPYVGWFRHAPPSQHRHSYTSSSCSPTSSNGSNRLLKRTLTLEQELLALLASLPVFQNEKHVLQLTDYLLSGNLKGGSRCQQDDSPSLTVHLLTRLACWLFLPSDLLQRQHEHFALYDKKKRLMHSDDAESMSMLSEEVMDDESEYSHDDDEESDNSSCTTNTITRQDCTTPEQEEPLGFSVSRQAEDYYAHALSKELYSQDEIDNSRLDYDITQMDIVRMNRNASRHLDVESIVKLPTVIYKKQETATPPKTEEWSWMLVPTTTTTNTKTPDQDPQDDDNEKDNTVCVICLEAFCDGDRLRVLPCNHSFHTGCIDRWLSGCHSFDDCHTAGCPTCKSRADGVVDDQQPDDDASLVVDEHDGQSLVPGWAFLRIGDALARSQHA